MPPKKRKLNADPNQRSVAFMFGKTPNELDDQCTDDTVESKQSVLIDLSMHQVKNEIGIDWTIMFNFDIHFIDARSQQIDSERDVDVQSAGQSASTSATATPIESGDDDEDDDDNDEDSEDEIASVGTSDGQCKQKTNILLQE